VAFHHVGYDRKNQGINWSY